MDTSSKQDESQAAYMLDKVRAERDWAEAEVERLTADLVLAQQDRSGMRRSLSKALGNDDDAGVFFWRDLLDSVRGLTAERDRLGAELEAERVNTDKAVVHFEELSTGYLRRVEEAEVQRDEARRSICRNSMCGRTEAGVAEARGWGYLYDGGRAPRDVTLHELWPELDGERVAVEGSTGSSGEAPPEPTRENLIEAIRWALGERDTGSLGGRPDGAGRFWWRAELRERSGLTEVDIEPDPETEGASS